MQVHGPNLSAIAKSVVILLVSFNGALASANPNIFSHPILGEVHVASPEDQNYFNGFLPYLEKANRVAQANGIEDLNIRLTLYSSAIDKDEYLKELPIRAPFYLPPQKLLVIGGLSPRPQNIRDERGQHSASIHEVGHAYLASYFMKVVLDRSPLEPSPLRSIVNPSFRPYGEFFADAFAGLILGEFDLVLNEIRGHWDYLESIQTPADRALRALGLLPSFRLPRNELRNRSAALEVEVQACSAHQPEIHNMFPRSRHFIWQTVFVEKLGRDQDRVSEIVDQLAWVMFSLNPDIFQHELRREQSLRRAGITAIQEASLPLSERLSIVQPYLSIGHQWLDEQLLLKLQSEFL